MSGTLELQEQLKAVQAKYDAQSVEFKKLVDENQQLKNDITAARAKFSALEAADKARQQTEERKILGASLDEMVKSKKIAPFTRESLMRQYDAATTEAEKEVVKCSVKNIQEVIDTNPAFFGVEQARLKADQEDRESTMDASEVVVARTNEYMAKHGEKSFTVAKTAVLKADPDLANRYTKMEG